MRTLFSAPRWVLLACAAFIVITWLDMLDLIESITLLAQPGYGERNYVLTLGGRATIAGVKLVIPIILGALLIVAYRTAPRAFRATVITLWFAAIPYAAVVLHNLSLLWR
jgi:hypothetical protein